MPTPDFSAILELPPCRLGLAECDGAITGLTFLPPDHPLRPAASPLALRLADQLAAYLRDPACEFDLPLDIQGTPFQKRVWREISAIPAGQALQYRDLALALGSIARAVGQACGANRHPIAVPCHRVVSANGLGGFANHTDGWLLQTKRWLLWHEGLLI